MSVSDESGRDLSEREPVVPWGALIVDVFAVTVFAVTARLAHGESLNPGGMLLTTSPFVAATCLGWAYLLWHGGPRPGGVPGGIVVWLVTVGAGMAVRLAAGLDVKLMFVLFAAGFIGVTVVGWRALGAYLVHRFSR
ncbi:hypothetical protein KEM60_01592 [Austwickia sp. TVS 96-490-7B]|uniref:DUF3054 domain-containing protein n=1 Tax=Austwickia sp. TVS 96-490-7B TaxID=2830843 RepID=UPI001C576EF3|nr:DUF3054 domain-containing protein [Austwickia sp. TVS 96-490-7B]MBW3085392.1 hypothetical protein [Austwickia sp. TVS 96-490-7B]